jgi:aspartate carbamoyltransferase regulatory subunit
MMENSSRQKKQVAKLRHGTVIDHLSPGMALKALEMIGIPHDSSALIGVNLASKKAGRKDILKLENVELSEEQIENLAVLGPSATVCYIRDYEIVKKVHVALPDVLEGVLRCPNPNCVTNHERIPTRFDVECPSPTQVRCTFCERLLSEDDIVLI